MSVQIKVILNNMNNINAYETARVIYDIVLITLWNVFAVLYMTIAEACPPPPNCWPFPRDPVNEKFIPVLCYCFGREETINQTHAFHLDQDNNNVGTPLFWYEFFNRSFSTNGPMGKTMSS